MGNQNEELNTNAENVKKEKQSKMKIFLTYFPAPVLVVVLQLGFSWMQNQDENEIHQIEIAQSMLPSLFSDDVNVSAATNSLLKAILKNDKLENEVERLATNHINNITKKLYEEENYDSVLAVQDAAKENGIETLVDSATQQTLDRYSRARESELGGFEYLAANKIDSAIEKFSEASEVHPTLHSVKEIKDLLESKKDSMADEKTAKRVYKEIVNSYSWKVPKKIIEKIEKRSDE